MLWGQQNKNDTLNFIEIDHMRKELEELRNNKRELEHALKAAHSKIKKIRGQKNKLLQKLHSSKSKQDINKETSSSTNHKTNAKSLFFAIRDREE